MYIVLQCKSALPAVGDPGLTPSKWVPFYLRLKDIILVWCFLNEFLISVVD